MSDIVTLPMMHQSSLPIMQQYYALPTERTEPLLPLDTKRGEIRLISITIGQICTNGVTFERADASQLANMAYIGSNDLEIDGVSFYPL